MASNAGANSAAGDIKRYVKLLLVRQEERPDEVKDLLMEIIKYCENIQSQCEGGWY